jgi:hypothetical protein
MAADFDLALGFSAAQQAWQPENEGIVRSGLW